MKKTRLTAFGEQYQGLRPNPLLYCGVPGVRIFRTSANNRECVEVGSCQKLIDTNTLKVRNALRYLGRIYLDEFEQNSTETQARFTTLISNAVALQRYYNVQVTERGFNPIGRAFEMSDLPQSEDTRVAPPVALSLSDIFASFKALQRPRELRPVSQNLSDDRSKLLKLNLKQPIKPLYARGRYLRFYPRFAGWAKFYLPGPIGRAAERWVIRLHHSDGFIAEDIHDSDFDGNPHKSAQHAWQRLVDHLIETNLPEKRALNYKEPMLATGMDGLFFQPHERPLKSGGSTWRFMVKIRLKTESGKPQVLLIRGERVEDWTTQNLQEALRHGEAILRYWNHQLDKDRASASIPENLSVPREFWTEKPICRITSQDLALYVRQNSRSPG